MMPPYQVPLAIDRPLQQTLDNFVVGANEELLRQLTQPHNHFSGIWIAGQPQSGKSHLLRGCALALTEAGTPTTYVDGGNVDGGQGLAKGMRSLEHAVAHNLPVCIDNIAGFAGHQEAEELLLASYQQALQAQSLFVVSHLVAAVGVDFNLADLNSRVRSLLHYALLPLNDQDKAELLRARADRRGYKINQAVLDYWLARAPRDTGTLLTDLDVLDRATLARKQTVTIPLLKQVLGY